MTILRAERRIVESTLFTFLLGLFYSSSSSYFFFLLLLGMERKALSSLSWFYPCVTKRPNNRDTHFFPSLRPSAIVSRIRLFPPAFFVSIFDPSIRPPLQIIREKKIHPPFQTCKISLFLSLYLSLFFFFQPRVENLKFKWGGEKNQGRSEIKRVWNDFWLAVFAVYMGRE